jgi:hypothetical protein
MVALADIPPDLLDVAVKHCIRTCAFFPKPAELRAAIKDEMIDRSRQQQREYEARRAALAAPASVAPPSPEDIAYVEKIVAPVIAGVRRRARVFHEAPRGPGETLPPFHLCDPDDPRVAAYLDEEEM